MGLGHGRLSCSIHHVHVLHVSFHRLKVIVVEELLDEVHVRHKHAPAAVALETQVVQSQPAAGGREGGGFQG